MRERIKKHCPENAPALEMKLGIAEEKSKKKELPSQLSSKQIAALKKAVERRERRKRLEALGLTDDQIKEVERLIDEEGMTEDAAIKKVRDREIGMER